MKYILRRSLVALAGDETWATIPAGSTVEVPAMIVGAVKMKVRYKDQMLTVLAKEFFDSARIVPSE